MYLDAVDLMEFYHRRQGVMVQRLLQRCMNDVWPQPAAGTLVGLGYCIPYLPNANTVDHRVFAFMPARQGVVRWPREGPAAAALIDETALPLPGGSIERIMAIHALEMSNAPQVLLDEAWRVLVPGGELVVVVPNRRSPWTRVDTTPFGYGAPFSRTQLRRLLRATHFQPEEWQGALHVPPLRSALTIRWADTLERTGRRLWPALSGLIVVRASKQPFQGEPVRGALPNLLKPVLMPGASAT